MRKTLILTILAGLMLAACGPKPASLPTPTPLQPSPSPQPSPTATATIPPRPTATPLPTMEAAATLVAEAQPTLEAVATQASGIDFSGFIKSAAIKLAVDELNQYAAGRFNCEEASWTHDAIALTCLLPNAADSTTHLGLHFMVIENLSKVSLEDQRLANLLNEQTTLSFTTGTVNSPRAYRSVSTLALLRQVADGSLGTAAAWGREAGFTEVTR